MKAHFILSTVTALLLLSARAQGDPLAPKTESFSGDYKLVRVAVEPLWPARGKEKGLRPFTLLATFRDGVPAGAWAHGVSATPAAMHLRERDARLTADALKGRLGLFFGDGTIGSAAAWTRLELDLKISAGVVAGTVALNDGKPVSAKGVLVSEPELSKANMFAPGKDWPAWQGVDASVRGPSSGAALVESWAQARPVWRSEAVLPVSYGNAADFRYALRAAAQGTCGGASSPVVAGGRVFSYFYQPSGAVDETAATAALAKSDKPLADFQQAWVRDMYRLSADDVVLALDAATGRLLWRTTFPQRTLNLQTHKHRGVNPTPLIAGDALFVPTYTGRVYRLAAATGAVRWEFPAAATKPFIGKTGQGGSGDVPVGCASPVLLGGTLGVTLRNELVGIAAENGRQLWKVNVGRDAQLYAWHEAFLAVGEKPALKKGDASSALLTLVNPADGRVLWQAEADFPRTYRQPVIAGDLLLAYRFGADAANNITDGAKNSLLAFHLRADGIAPAWTLTGLPTVTDSYGLAAHDGHAYLSGESEVWAVSLRDGKVVARVTGTGGARTQVMWTAEDRLFLCPEGRHGTCGLTMLTAHGPQMRLLGGDEFQWHNWRGAWLVENPFATAYANHQIIHPVVDGRLFVRGADGIYCYDLRKP